MLSMVIVVVDVVVVVIVVVVVVVFRFDCFIQNEINKKRQIV